MVTFWSCPAQLAVPNAYDKTEFERSVATLRLVSDLFVKNGVKAAIEPIRSAEVSDFVPHHGR